MTDTPFKSYSRNLNSFLREEGIFYIDKGVHQTGVAISLDGGKNWSDYTSVVKALSDHYKLFQRKELETFRDEALNGDAPVKTGKFVTDSDGKVHEVLVRKRIRYFKTYESNDRLKTALTRWKESGPNAGK